MILDALFFERYDEYVAMNNNVITQRRKFTEAAAPHPRTRTELKHRNLVISFSDARLIVEWMNATKGTQAYRRVIRIRAHLEHLNVMLDTIRQQKRQSTIDAEIRLRLNLVNQRLSRYMFIPMLACDPNAGILRYDATPKAMHGRVIEVSDGSLAVQVNESTVVAALSRLAASRQLHKAHLCEECRKRWHISERKMDRFCCKDCRRAFCAQRPDHRERQRIIQKRYRENLKVKLAAEDAVRLSRIRDDAGVE
jgi:hypothetical protein